MYVYMYVCKKERDDETLPILRATYILHIIHTYIHTYIQMHTYIGQNNRHNKQNKGRTRRREPPIPHTRNIYFTHHAYIHTNTHNTYTQIKVMDAINNTASGDETLPTSHTRSIYLTQHTYIHVHRQVKVMDAVHTIASDDETVPKPHTCDIYLTLSLCPLCVYVCIYIYIYIYIYKHIHRYVYIHTQTHTIYTHRSK
jgi:hypothetical protein